MAWRSHRKGLAIVGVFLFLMGVVVPAAFGLLTEKAMELGTADLLDKSTNWEADYTNSTYFLGVKTVFYDNETGTKYSPAFVPDSMDLDLVMMDQENVISSATGTSDFFYANYYINVSKLDNIDKFVVLVKIEDPAQMNIDNTKVVVSLLTDNPTTIEIYSVTYNASAAINNTLRVEIALDAVKRLKFRQGKDQRIMILLRSKDTTNINLNNAIVGIRVELYDVKKVNTTAASNIMLAVSGVLGWLGALAATPYWNPMKNPEHRNIRGAYKKVRGKIRVPRRRR